MTKQTQDSQLSEQDFQAQLEEAIAARQAAEEGHKRALADYQNLLQRTRQERQLVVERACADLLSDLLPTLDHLELAMQHFTDPSLKMVAGELHKTLEKHGLTKIATVGESFDPLTMEAVDTAPGTKDVVVAQQRAGYQLGSAILRHASVVVGNGVANSH